MKKWTFATLWALLIAALTTAPAFADIIPMPDPDPVPTPEPPNTGDSTITVVLIVAAAVIAAASIVWVIVRRHRLHTAD